MDYNFYEIIKGKGVIIDTEYNNMNSHKATKLWCACTIDIQTGERRSFSPSNEGPEEFHTSFQTELKDYLSKFDFFVGHHFHGAEYWVLKNLIGFDIPPSKIVDTLVLSRLLRPTTPFIDISKELERKGLDTRLGGHSIDAYGRRMGDLKIDFNMFDLFTFKMLTYCEQDTELGLKVFNQLVKEAFTYEYSAESIWVEHEAHRLLTLQSINGFTIDRAAARKMLDETDALLQTYLNELQNVFPPLKVPVRTFKPRVKKVPIRTPDGKLKKPLEYKEEMHGQDAKTLIKNIHEENPDGTYTIFSMEEFNPSSPQQVGKRLISLGWNPKKFTATGQPSTDKEVLGEAIDQLSLQVPEVEVLRKYNIVTHRNGLAREWLQLSEEDGKLHGRVNHVGPWTHRCSHFEPNMANIPKVSVGKDKKPLEGFAGNFGWDCRNCFVASSEDNVIVGADAAGIQLRALAHYMGDENYIKEVISGDIHTTNMKAANIEKGYHGMSPRDVAKRFIYAWLLGAGDEKVGIIVGVDESEYEALFEKAKHEDKFNRFRHKNFKEKRNEYDNLLRYVSDKLRVDGRRVDKITVATILKGYYTKKQFLSNLPTLKNFKEVEIKQAAKQGYMFGLDGRKIWVPSEHLAMGAYLQGYEAVVMKHAMVLYQKTLTEKGIWFKQCAFVHDEFQIECRKEDAEEVGKTVVWAIEETGRRLGSKTPLTGEYKIGQSWGQTH